MTINNDFVKNGNLFGTTLLPASIYEARQMVVNGKTYVYPALRESSDLLVVDELRSTPDKMYYTLPVYKNVPNNNKYWLPCQTGTNAEHDISRIVFINAVDECILSQLLNMKPEDWQKTGYTISHWVFELNDKGETIPIEGNTQSHRTQCAITGYQSATWVIAHKSNGSTKSNGERISYVATGFIPIDRTDITMHHYHALGYYLVHSIGKYTVKNPTANGLEIEFNFHANIGIYDHNRVSADKKDKIKYEGVYLNRRGVMATALLKLYRFQPIVTADSTVNFELLMRPCTSLTALKDEFCALKVLFDIKSFYGSHIHASVISSNIDNLFANFSPEEDIFPIAEKLFKPFIEELKNDFYATEDIFGRYFTDWANDHIGYCDHHSAINVTEYYTLEFRLSKYQNELQYLRLINMVDAMTLELYAVLKGNKTVESAQKKIFAIWIEAKNHKTRTDKNAKKTPNEQGTRHRNVA